MRAPLRIAATTVVLTLMLAACSSSGGSNNSSKKSSGSSGAVATTSVSIKGFAFNPDAITAKIGDSITITNDDTTTHTATSTGGPGSFDTGDLSKGSSKKVKVTKAGTYKYHCSIHTYMTGTIKVA